MADFVDTLDNDEVDLSAIPGEENNGENIWGGLSGDEIIGSLVSGTYFCELYEIKRHFNPDKETNHIIFSWSVADENSEFYGMTFQQWFSVYPNLAQLRETLAPKYKAQINKSLNFLKKHLFRLGLSETEVNTGDWDALMKRVGINRIIEVVAKEDSDFVNVKNIQESPDHADEPEDDGFSLS